MSLKGKGDFSSLGGIRLACCHQTSFLSLLSGPDRGVCLLEGEPTFLHYNMIWWTEQDTAQCQFTRSLCHVCQVQPYIELFQNSGCIFLGHFLIPSLPSHFLSLKHFLSCHKITHHLEFYGKLLNMIRYNCRVSHYFIRGVKDVTNKCQGCLSESLLWLMLMLRQRQIYISILFVVMWF